MMNEYKSAETILSFSLCKTETKGAQCHKAKTMKSDTEILDDQETPLLLMSFKTCGQFNKDRSPCSVRIWPRNIQQVRENCKHLQS